MRLGDIIDALGNNNSILEGYYHQYYEGCRDGCH